MSIMKWVVSFVAFMALIMFASKLLADFIVWLKELRAKRLDKLHRRQDIGKRRR